jgi:hypothetical protein
MPSLEHEAQADRPTDLRIYKPCLESERQTDRQVHARQLGARWRALTVGRAAWGMHGRIPSQLKRPSLVSESKSLYMQAPPALEARTRPNLTRTLSELLVSGERITVTDPGLPFSIDVEVVLT